MVVPTAASTGDRMSRMPPFAPAYRQPDYIKPPDPLASLWAAYLWHQVFGHDSPECLYPASQVPNHIHNCSCGARLYFGYRLKEKRFLRPDVWEPAPALSSSATEKPLRWPCGCTGDVGNATYDCPLHRENHLPVPTMESLQKGLADIKEGRTVPWTDLKAELGLTGLSDPYYEGFDPPCPLPPKGWICTREAGHDGPCAGVPTTQVSKEEQTAIIRRALNNPVLMDQLSRGLRSAPTVKPIPCPVTGAPVAEPASEPRGSSVWVWSVNDLPGGIWILTGDSVSQAQGWRYRKATETEILRGIAKDHHTNYRPGDRALIDESCRDE